MTAHYTLPMRYDDATWLKLRHALIEFSPERDLAIELDFSACEWIDLHPLVDLFLHCSKALIRGHALRLRFSKEGTNPPGRVLRFLYDTDFIKTLQSIAAQNGTSLTYAVGSNVPPSNDSSVLLPTLEAAKRVLDTATIVPCLIDDAARFMTRDDVFAYCRQLREDSFSRHLSRAQGIAVPLAHELKLFFNSVLPELIDNVRLHKPGDEHSRLFAIFIRLRRRDEENLGVQRIAESSFVQLTKFQSQTSHYWQHDIIEAAYSDDGPSIQDTFLSSQSLVSARLNRRVPRLPGNRVRVDNKNGDFLILKHILTENASRLTASERTVQGLPLRATGLNSIRRSIVGTNCAFAVRSGRNYAVVLPTSGKSLDDPVPEVIVSLAGQFHKSPGVHYFFRLAPLRGRPLETWASGIPEGGLENSLRWWESTYEKRFDRVHLVSEYICPPEASVGDVVVCRAHHLVPKRELAHYLKTISSAGLHLIFFEMPASFALRLYNYLCILSAEMPLSVPIITTSLRVAVVARDPPDAVKSFVQEKASESSYWWTQASAPVKCLRELFVLSRIRDSQVFWNSVTSPEDGFLHEPVRWAQDVILRGGYLVFQAVLRKPELRKLARKRLAMLIEQLDVGDMVPSSDAVRKLCSEVERELYFQVSGRERYAVVGSVLVTSRTMRRAEAPKQAGRIALHVPLFVYPTTLVSMLPTATRTLDRQHVRAFDWRLENNFDSAPSWSELETQVVFTRSGSTEGLTRKSESPLHIECAQKPAEAYSVWQRHALLEMGHFSYGPHHYYVWIDLRRFILERSPASEEMLLGMLETFRKWEPDWIFYEPHETTEVLIDRLCEKSSEERLNVVLRERTWPIEQAQLLFNMRLGAPEAACRDDWKVAVFVDDGMVSGYAIRKAKALLHRLGFQTVHSLVLLDRAAPDRSVLAGCSSTGEHYAWWSMYVPPTGSASSCRICKGLEVVRALAVRAGADSFRAVLDSWANRWAERDNLDRFRAAIEGRNLERALCKRLGNPKSSDIVLRTSEAVCTWALDLPTRLSFPAFLLESQETPHEVGNAIAECLAGVLLHRWDDLSDIYKGALLDRLLDQLWSETRTAARGLIAIGLLSLNVSESAAVFKRVTDKVRSVGLPDLETTVFCYAVVHRVATDPKNAEKRFYSWIRTIHEGKDLTGKLAIKRTNTLVATLVAADNRGTPERFALQILGLPGRGVIHQHLYALLDEAKSAKALDAKQVETLALVRAYLDPIRACVDTCRPLFESAKLATHLDRAFRKFDMFFQTINSSMPSSASLPDTREMGFMIDNLVCLLKTSYRGLSNARQVLSKEYVHYLPFLVRQVIQEISSKGTSDNDGPRSSDFEINCTPTEEEIEMFGKFPPNGPNRDRKIEQMHKYDVAIVARAIAWQAIRDCLTDVKHPKKQKKSIYRGKGFFMKVSSCLDENDRGQTQARLSFENRATRDDYDKSRGNSWSVVCALMQEAGGSAESSFSSGFMQRILVFPALRQRPGV